MRTIIEPWTAGASALRQFTYRVVETDGETQLQVKPLEAPDSDYVAAERGHRVAQEVARLLLEEKRVISLRRAAR